MRKILTIMFLGLALAGCATINEDRLYNAKAGYGVALAQAVAYRRLCIAKRLGDFQANCKAVVARLEGYDRNAQAALSAAASNPSFITVAETAVATFKAAATSPGGM